MPRTACKSQCKQCPFRATSMRGWLGGYETPERVVDSLWHKVSFFCHTRTDYVRDDWEAHAERHGKLCLGALIAIGRRETWPRQDAPDWRKALATAMAFAAEHPDRVDVMEFKQFIDYHNDSPFRRWKAEQHTTET